MLSLATDAALRPGGRAWGKDEGTLLKTFAVTHLPVQASCVPDPSFSSVAYPGFHLDGGGDCTPWGLGDMEYPPNDDGGGGLRDLRREIIKNGVYRI